MKRSIQLKFGGIIIVLTTLIMSALALHEYTSARSNLETKLTTLSATATQRLSGSLVPALWDMSEDLAGRILESEMLQEEIFAIVVREAGKRGIFSGRSRGEKWEVVKREEAVEGDYVTAVAEVVREKEALGTVQVFLSRKFMARALRELMLEKLVSTVILNLVLLGCMLFCLRRIVVAPILQVTAGLAEIAEGDGDLTRRLPTDSGDEIAALSARFNAFMDQLQGMIVNVAGNAGDLTTASETLSAISGQMAEGSRQTAAQSDTVAAAGEEMSGSMSSVAAAMEEAAVNVGLIATSAEQMTTTIDEISRNTEDARGITGEAVNRANRCSEQVSALGQAAEEIGKVVGTITEISEQVNLLALNATIEAARAGDAGKGFAVVAGEIKELAGQTAEASLEIKERVTRIQNSTDGTVEGIQAINGVVGDIENIVGTIAAAVEEQSLTTREIAENVNQTSSGIGEVNENVNQCSAVASEIATAIAEVSQSAGEMSKASTNVDDNAQGLSRLAAGLDRTVGRFTTDEGGKAGEAQGA